MIVCASAHELNTAVHKALGQSLRIVDDPACIFLVFGLQVLLEHDCLRRDRVHLGTALCTREDALVQLVNLGKFSVGQDHSSARSAKCLVGRCCGDMSVRNRARMISGRYESCDVGHINHEISADHIRDIAHSLEVDCSAVS